ncbi:unnamed protein product [Urochloa decumbens]|uniref:Fucosyltransferase n=1 Tax=Urochloa decumbens TaxID=240449 RepID=A0ABC9FMB2_9POAL
MEMTSGANNYRRVPDDELVGDPAAAAAEPWPPAAATEKETRRRRALAIAGLMALPLLVAFFVLGRESASTVWDFASAKLMNNAFFNNASPRHGKPAAAADVDELLGGLLAPGMDRRSCRSRHQLHRYFKHFPYAPSPHLLSKLRAYESLHRRCAPGTPLYADAISRLRSGLGAAAAGEESCSYMVWLPFDGLGNRMLSMASGFLYALLTGRVFLAAVPPDSADLFCEPFPNATWLLPVEDFPVANLFGLGPRPDHSLTRLLAKNKIPVAGADGDLPAASNATVPAYVYLSLGWQKTDLRPFFCGENQRALAKVSWLLLYSDLYFAPSLYKIAGFHGELRRMFPEREATAHLLLRYLLHPGNAVWGLVTRYYGAYLAPANRRVGVQIRMSAAGDDHVPAGDKYNQILACSRQENNILPETTADGDAGAGASNLTTTSGGSSDDGGDNGNSTAILVASLFAEYYERLRSRYYEHAAVTGAAAAWVGVFQPTHEEVQATGKLEHNRKALAEIYLLSFSDELVTSGLSTFGYVSAGLAGVRPTILLTAFGHKVPEPPCRRAVSMEPCNLTPPPDVKCRAKFVDEEDLTRHLKICEDWTKGVKLYD